MPRGLATGLGNLSLGAGVFNQGAPVEGPGVIVMPEYLRYRVLDTNTGAVVIPDLPHPHRSRWEVRGMQGATAGNSNVGSFEIPLFEPLTAEGQAAAADYARLAHNQRIEGYLGDVIAGQPRFSGVIRTLPTGLTDQKITGTTWNYLLQLQKTLRTEAFIGTTGFLAQEMIRNWQATLLDDFTGPTLGAYTATTYVLGTGNPAGNGSWALVPAAASPLGLPSIRGHADAFNQCVLLTNATFPQAAWDDCVLEATFHFFPDASQFGGSLMNPDVLKAGNLGFVLNATDASNAQLGSVRAIFSATLDSSGVPTFLSQQYQADSENLRGTPPNPAVDYVALGGGFASIPTLGPGTDYHYQLQAQGKWSGSQYTWRLIVNGADMGVSVVTPRPVAGKVGFFIYGGMSNGSGSVPQAAGTRPYGYVANFTFRSRVNQWFSQGAFAPPAKALTEIVSRNSQLDLLTAAATLEGFVYLDTPQPGSDRVDWGPSIQGGPAPATIGRDLSAQISFREGHNLIEPEIEPNMETLATDIELGTGSTPDAAAIHWLNIPAARRFGILTDAVQSTRTGDFQSDIAWARALAGFRSNPGLSKTLTVLRDLDTADKWREMDVVTVHAPSIGVTEQKVLVLGYEFAEGEPTMKIMGDQYPIRMLSARERRWWQQVAALAEGMTALTPSSGGTPFDATYGQPNVITATSGGINISGNGDQCNTFLSLANDDAFMLRCEFSFHIEGGVAMQISIVFDGVGRPTTALGTALFGAGDYGPYNLLPDIQGFVGNATLQAINTNGSAGFMSSQVNIYVPAKSS